MINILNFFLVSKEQFQEILNHFNIIISSTSNEYLILYLLVNFYAILCIYLSIKIILKIVQSLFKKRRRRSFL